MVCPQSACRQSQLLVVISGPSGVGKDSVVSALLERDPALLRVITATDRPQRPGEIDGVDYHFVSTTEFERMIAEDRMIEWARVYHQYKGIPKAELERALATGRDVIVRVDVQGAAMVKQLMPEAILIFVTASSEKEMIRRLRERGGDTEDQVEARIATAQEELSHLDEFGYLIVNCRGRLDQAVAKAEAILAAERCRIGRLAP
jgi:guanylate kinase